MENIETKEIKEFHTSGKLHTKAVNEQGQDVYTFIFSTNEIDRDEEIVITAGIEITNYLTNPVVLKSHASYELPIGKVVNIWLGSEGLLPDGTTKTVLYGDIVFGDDKESQEVKMKVDSGILRAVSIGFKCKEWTKDESKDVRIYTKTELLEVSLVSLPSNPSAIRIKELNTQNIEIDYELLTEKIVNKVLNSEIYIEKIGASISRNNKTKLKEIHDLIDTVTMDLHSCKTNLLEIVDSFDGLDTPAPATFESPKETEIEIEKTNSVDITNKQTLLTIIKGN